MGSVVGEKIAKAIDVSIKKKCPFMLITKSGGARMMEAGFSGREIIKTATYLPANYWGLGELGQINEGYRASFLVYAENPIENPTILSHPTQVWIDGHVQE